MADRLARPTFPTTAAYRARFADDEFWAPQAAAALSRHRIEFGQLRRGALGTCPVFIADDRVVVKLFPYLFDGADAFAAERLLAHLTPPALGSPTLVAEGTLYPSARGWVWPYLVTTVVPGRSVEELDLPEPERIRAARWLAPRLRDLHRTKVLAPRGWSSETRRFMDAAPTPGWEDFRRFMKERRNGLVARQRRWGLPGRLLAELPGWLPSTKDLLEDGEPSLIHADLTADHVLGSVQRGRFTPTGVIDYGDAMVGDPLYDLVALHIDMLRGSRRGLAAFLHAYDPGESMLRDLPRRALSYCLLHGFDVLSSVPAVRRARSLDALARALFGL